jgi:hypothetical protein
LGGRDWEDQDLRPAQKKISETSISTNETGMVIQICNPTYAGGIGRRITVPGWPVQKCERLSEKQPKGKRAGGVSQVELVLPSNARP